MKRCVRCGRNTKGNDCYCKNCLKDFENIKKSMNKNIKVKNVK